MSFTFNIHAPPWQPEGTDSAIGVRGVTLQTSSTPTALTKLDGQRPAPDLALPRRTSKPNAHRKKAYLKAVKRATLHGVTWYRGQYLTATQLGVKSLSLPPPQADSPTQPPGLQTVEVRPNRQPPSAFRQGRLTYLSWNIGRLTLIKWDLFRSWLHRQTVDCVCLQDTGWDFTGEWTDQDYAYIHAGATHHRGGLLTVVKLRFCSVDSIAWTIPLNSRVLHVRLYKGSFNLDVVNVYQFPYNPNDPSCLADRQTVWKTLRSTFSGLPRRNCWLIGGDFNTGLRHHAQLVGLGDFNTPTGRRTGCSHPDQRVFQELVRDFSLMALNSWLPSLGATYEGPNHATSRIDFVLVQQRDGDAASKKVIYLRDLPQMMGLHRDHVPLLGGLPWRRFYVPKTSTGLSRTQRLTLHHHWFHDTEDWKNLTHSIKDQMKHLHPQQPDLSGLNQLLIDSCRQFSTTPTPPQDRWPLKWSWTLQCGAAPLPPSEAGSQLLGIFQGWLWVTKRTRWRKKARRAATEHRRARLQRILDTARFHWAGNQTHQFFQTVQKLTPKTFSSRPHLRGPQGKLLSPTEEMDTLSTYMTELYQGHDEDFPPFYFGSSPVDSEQLEYELLHLQGNKAVPSHIAPGFLWKALAPSISPLVTGWCTEWFRSGHLPEEWKSGWIVFLTKPHKAPTQPSALRPIALQTPLSKCVMSLMVQRARHFALPVLNTLPQFAYLPGRGAWDAICRVHKHAQEVRELSDRWRYHAGRLNRPEGARPTLYGGCQLFLDLTQAFDHMPRQSLQAAFDQLGIPIPLSNVLLQWHTGTKYILNYKGQVRTIRTYKGVRQGCRGAPFFWATFIALVLREVARVTSESWMMSSCTFYADDGHLCFLFTDMHSFEHGLHCMGRVLDVLHDLGMKVNLQKSAILLELKGTHQRTVRKEIFALPPASDDVDHPRFPRTV